MELKAKLDDLADWGAIGKLVRTFGRALKETGHGRVELASGSWRLDFLKSADRYLPKEPFPASTLVIVSGLADPDMKVEIEVVAAR